MPNAQTAICLDADYKIQRLLFSSKPRLAFAMTVMGPLDFLNHLLNFVAPAVCVGLFVAMVAPLMYRKTPMSRSLRAQAAINVVAGLMALLAGLLFFGRDGKMASYAALVLACAASQWWAMRR